MVPSHKRPLCHPCCSCSAAGATCGGAAAASDLGGLDIGDGVTKRALIRSERHAKDGPRANFAVEPESAIRIGVRAILKVAHPKSTFLSVKSGRIIQSPLTSPGAIGNALLMVPLDDTCGRSALGGEEEEMMDVAEYRLGLKELQQRPQA